MSDPAEVSSSVNAGRVAESALDLAALHVPTLPLLHFVSLLNGLGTMLLGPILPLLAARWHLSDAQSGLLLMSQFCGSFLGGVSTSQRLRRGLLEGVAAASAGLFLFALAPGLEWACAGLVVGGFGVGRAITAVNIVAGRRATAHRGSALSWINLSWSVGALLSPLLAAFLTPFVPLTRLLMILPGLFLLSGMLMLIREAHLATGASGVPADRDPEELAAADEAAPGAGFPASIYVFFLALLLLYGGLETCLSAWLTTFAIRYGQDSLALSEYTVVLLLSGLTAGRAASAWLLLRVRDRTLVRIALGLSAGLAAALAGAHQTSIIAVLAILLGFALAPIFPGTFAMLLAHRPPARKAAIVLAASGLGAAAFPWLMGVVSTRAGSLQLALAIPVAVAAGMLSLCFLPASADAAPG